MTVDNHSHDKLEQSIADIDWQTYQQRDYTASPVAWEDQVLYFLFLDRFSNAQETAYLDNNKVKVTTGNIPPFDFSADAYRTDYEQWRDQGNRWQNGTLKGLESKIGYLKRLGITAIWISPIFKQRLDDEYSYHGYAIQNFLDVDPHYGTRQDLKELVDTAHQHGIYVILDIIFNHAGDVFDYDADRYQTQGDDGNVYMDPRWDGFPYRVKGFRDAEGKADLPFNRLDKTHPQAWPDQAVWPAELQQPATYTQMGRINNWEHDPEYLQGDFISLKDIDHGAHAMDEHGNRLLDHYHPSAALKAMCDIYKFWISFADIDGYRIDTVKHMEPGATRYFTSVIHEHAQSLGKENFYLIGEITGGRQLAFELMEKTGLNAALGINDIPDRLEYLAKGYRNPQDYFGLFRNSVLLNKGSHIWYGKHIVTLFDDHDQVRKGNNKARFCGDRQNRGYEHLPAVLALNLLSIGIPCLYYGTEQAFDGAGDNDRFLRECMFGGQFGSLQSKNRHFFNEQHDTYRFISAILELRKNNIALRRGRQYLRQISAVGESGTFGYPKMIGERILSVIPWSRIFNNQEFLIAINSDIDQARTAWVTVDRDLHIATDSTMQCLYSTEAGQIGSELQVIPVHGRAVKLTVPAGGVVIFN